MVVWVTCDGAVCIVVLVYVCCSVGYLWWCSVYLGVGVCVVVWVTFGGTCVYHGSGVAGCWL